MIAKKQAKKLARRIHEIDRLFDALNNFLIFGYDKEYQKTESAIEQLRKLRNLVRR